MGIWQMGRKLWRKALHLIITTMRVQVVILNYVVTSVACIFNGKKALQLSKNVVDSTDNLAKDGFSEKDEERYVYVDTALAAVDQFWSKAEEKVWDMARRRVPNRTKMLLLDAINESYNKLKYRLREDLNAQEIELESTFEPLLAERNKKFAELRFLLVHSDTREDFPYEEQRPVSVHESLEDQLSSLTKVLSTADLLTKRPASMVEMIPVLKDVQREVSGMLEYLEGCRPNFNPRLIKDLTAEYQYQTVR